MMAKTALNIIVLLLLRRFQHGTSLVRLVVFVVTLFSAKVNYFFSHSLLSVQKPSFQTKLLG